MRDLPKLFGITLEVFDLEKASAFYSRLLGTKGRRVHGGRHYYDCGSVILALVDVSSERKKPRPIPGDIYFAVKNLKTIHSRASKLGCLSARVKS